MQKKLFNWNTGFGGRNDFIVVPSENSFLREITFVLFRLINIG